MLPQAGYAATICAPSHIFSGTGITGAVLTAKSSPPVPQGWDHAAGDNPAAGAAIHEERRFATATPRPQIRPDTGRWLTRGAIDAGSGGSVFAPLVGSVPALASSSVPLLVVGRIDGPPRWSVSCYVIAPTAGMVVDTC